MSAVSAAFARSCRHIRPRVISRRAMSVQAAAQPPVVAGRLVTDDTEIQAIAAGAKTVAVLGCKTEQQGNQPAFFVPEYLSQAGVNVIPVPVFYPDVQTILGKQVYRKVADVPEPYDILVLFRKPSDLPPHLPDILNAPHKPTCVWLQSGITNAEFERALILAGFQVVHDRCIMVEHRRGIASGNRSSL